MKESESSSGQYDAIDYGSRGNYAPESATALAESLFHLPTQIFDQEQRASTVSYHYIDQESSSIQQTNSGLLEEQLSRLFSAAKDEVFEDGMENNFSRAIQSFVEVYSHSAMEAIIRSLVSERINSEVASELMRIIGRIEQETTYRDRLWLLERGLYSKSARIRDGSIIGLASLDDPIAIDPIRSAIDRESVSELRHDMEQVLSQLEDTRNWHTS
jgi:hypothetical protein